MSDRTLVQCPDCLTYLYGERAKGEQGIWYLIPAHECWIGQAAAYVKARFVSEKQTYEALVIVDDLIADPAPDLAPFDGEPF
jgi:hypothetical protein